MDLEEARRLVYTRVQSLEPANVLKIMGYLLLQDIGEQELLRLAVSSDANLHAFVTKAKQELGLFPAQQQHDEQLQEHQNQIDVGERNLSDSSGNIYMHNAGAQQDLQTSNNESHGFGDSFDQDLAAKAAYFNHLYELMDQQERINSQFVKNPELSELLLSSSGNSYIDRLTRSNYELPAIASLVNASSSSSPASPAAAAWKPCLYFARGYCKHGSSCRFLHVAGKTGTFSPPSDDSQDSQGDPFPSLHSDSLEVLEGELRELLSARKAPVSIASLPQLYYEKFGRTLQADGYLTESQRHGKAGYSLTKLLARLKTTVSLIDRPHGQHAVVLTEDAHKFAGCRTDGEESCLLAANPGSRQIYLTFPAESGFSEEDVTSHFSAYGPVQDVRIPYQQKRMFGFVTFTYSETVRTILAEGNPHYICGARVLVKPYKEKGKIADKQAKLLQARSFDRNRHQQAALRYYLQERTMNEDDLAAALEQKLAELQLANIQKRMAENLFAASAAPVVPTYLESLHNLNPVNKPDAAVHDLPQAQLNPYGYVLDVLDSDSADDPGVKISTEDSSTSSSYTSKEQQALPCNIQSDQKQKFMTTPRDQSPPTFFSHDIF